MAGFGVIARDDEKGSGDFRLMEGGGVILE